MKKLSKVAAAVAISTAAVFASGPAANATILYEHNNYAGATYGADNSAWVGWFDNKASSIRNFGYYVIFYQHINYGGSAFGTSYDVPALNWYVPYLGTWNDNISSYRRA